jgi:hypothetical protein
VSKLLSQAKTQAFQVKEDAWTMESFTRMTVSTEAHAAAINGIRDHVNELGRLAAKLEQSKNMGSPWQKTAIDRINPMLQELASSTSTVVNYIANNRTKLSTQEYKDYLESNAHESEAVADLIRDFVDYGNAKAKMERLAAKLELK